MTRPSQAGIESVAVLADPVRRALFDIVSAGPEPVGRDEAAELAGIPRSTAAFHLDRLVGAGMLRAEFRRMTGKTGPGSGRPAKLYSRAAVEVSVTVPARDYELAGDLLASAVEVSTATGRPVRDALADIARSTGLDVGVRAGSLDAALVAGGYEPRPDGSGGYLLANCPFHRLARDHTDLVCATNVCFLQGVAEGAGADADVVRFEPLDAHCCVRIDGGVAAAH